MGTDPDRTSDSPARRDMLLVVLIGIALAVGGWLAYQTASAGAATSDSPEPLAAWPTLPPTVTPLPPAPAATPPPTPTPLPTPAIERIAELATLSHTFEVVQEATPEPGSTRWERIKQQFPGEDRIMIATTWKARYGVRLTDPGALQFTRGEDSIALTLPAVVALTVEEIGDARPVLTSQQLLFSDAPELATEAHNLARAEARRRADTNQEMLDVTEDLTRLRLEEWMRELGYTSVTIEFKPRERSTP